MRQVCLVINELSLILTLRNTPTADAIYQNLPINSHAQTWGNEVYFSVPVSAQLEQDAKEVVMAGEIAFWTEGSCIAIGFGPTPISTGNEIRLAAATNIWADTTDDVKQLHQVQSGDKIRIDKLGD